MAANFDFGMDEVLQSSQSSIVDEEEMAKMESEAVPDSTTKATKCGVNKLKNWLKKRNIDVNFHSVSADDLATILWRFYSEVKKDDGKSQMGEWLLNIPNFSDRVLFKIAK